MSEKVPKVFIVNQKSSKNIQTDSTQSQFNPLLQQLQQMKVTSNLVKEINFNTAANKFQYLEQLLAEKYQDFTQSVNSLSLKQVDLFNSLRSTFIKKQIKNLHRDILKISFQVQKQKQPASHQLLANKSQLLELHKQTEQVIETKKSSEKFLKLSEGMLNAVNKLERQLDQHVKAKIEDLNQSIKR